MRRLIPFLFMVLVLACSDSPAEQEPESTVITLSVVAASDGQSAVVGTALPYSPRVLVTRDNTPATGVTVTWQAETGVTSAGTSVTGSDGTTSVTWTLGSTPGAQTLHASVDSAQPGSVTLHASAVGSPDVVLSVVAVTNQQTGIAHRAIEHVPQVRVTMGDEPVQGVTVQWTAVTGQTVAQTSLTDPHGYAGMHWILGDVGPQELIATVAGAEPASVTITASAIAPPVTPAPIELLEPGDGGTLSLEFPRIKARITQAAYGQHVIGRLWDSSGALSGLDALVSGDQINFPANLLWHFVPGGLPGSRLLELELRDSSGFRRGIRPIAVQLVAADTAPRIVVHSFVIREYQYPSGEWGYAPELKVSDRAAGDGLEIIGISFPLVNGYASSGTFARYVPLRMPVLTSADIISVVGEHYGWWDLEFSRYDWARMDPPGQFRGRIVYRDRSGHVYATTMDLPVLPGSLPATFTGGCGNWVGAEGLIIERDFCSLSAPRRVRAQVR